MRRAVGGLVLALVAGAALPAGASSPAASLPSPIDRAGPSALYAPQPRAPQLQNSGGWRAQPLMVSGASAYRHGEFLYQDFLFDDLGAGSTITYPNNPYYAGDAADLVEVRLRLLKTGTAFRLTYNAMSDPTLVAATLALGESSVEHAMPFGANTKARGRVFVTAASDRGFASDAATGKMLDGVTVSTDLRRHQVDVRVPFSVWDPRGGSHRFAAAAGLWDDVKDSYLTPAATADATHPGGATGASPSAFFNVAFRYTEPFFAAATARDRLAWHESVQSAALASGSLGDLAATVDFAKLATGATDDLLGKPGGTPVSGHLALIYASRYASGEGRAASTNPCPQPCTRIPELPGQLQPYAAYVPAGRRPAAGWGLTLFLHACGVNYTPGDSVVLQLSGDRAPGSVVISPEGRGSCEWYWNSAGADVFEAWNDAGRRWTLDRSLTDVFGFSMGGYGTYKLATTYPDLFARAATIVGCAAANTQWAGDPSVPSSGAATSVVPLVASLRQVPLRAYAEQTDPTCTTPSQQNLKDALDGAGYRYEWVRAMGAHSGVGVAYGRVASFFGAARVVRDPAHVTYVLNQQMAQRAFGLDADGAYWVSGIVLKDRSGAAPQGRVDAVSSAFGTADPASSTPAPTPGVEGQYQPYPNVEQDRVWGAAPSSARRDALHITATNIARFVIDVHRARLTCRAAVTGTTNTDLDVVLAGCHRTVRLRP